MPLRSSAIYFASIWFCNLAILITVLPYYNLTQAPSVAGAVVGALTLLILFGLVSELLTPMGLSSLYAGSNMQQVFRGVATQVISSLIVIVCLKLIGRYTNNNKDWILLGAIFTIAIGAVAVANFVIRKWGMQDAR